MVDKGKAGKGVTDRADKSKAGKTKKVAKSAADTSTARLTDEDVTFVTVKDLIDRANRRSAGPNKASTGLGGDDIVDKAVDEKDKIDAIVSPRTDDPTARVVTGARVRNCAQCLADVFVAPSTFAFFKGKPMPPIWCVQCALLAAEVHSKSSRMGRA